MKTISRENFNNLLKNYGTEFSSQFTCLAVNADLGKEARSLYQNLYEFPGYTLESSLSKYYGIEDGEGEILSENMRPLLLLFFEQILKDMGEI